METLILKKITKESIFLEGYFENGIKVKKISKSRFRYANFEKLEAGKEYYLLDSSKGFILRRNYLY